MRFWIVQKDETIEAIFEAMEKGTCTTEAQVKAIAAKYEDHVEWASAWASEDDQTTCPFEECEMIEYPLVPCSKCPYGHIE